MLAVTTEKNTGSTIAKRTEFGNPNISKGIASMEIQAVIPFLAFPGRWNDIQHFLPRSVGRIDVVRPHENDFACMLAQFFTGPCEVPLRPVELSELFWTIHELRIGIRRLKNDKGGDEAGLTAGLLKHVPNEFLDALLRLYNDVLYTGEAPTSWSRTLFTMLPKKVESKTNDRFQTNCELTFVIQNVCLPPPWKIGTCI